MKTHFQKEYKVGMWGPFHKKKMCCDRATLRGCLICRGRIGVWEGRASWFLKWATFATVAEDTKKTETNNMIGHTVQFTKFEIRTPAQINKPIMPLNWKN